MVAAGGVMKQDWYKVLWYEGMALSPQHLQQADRYWHRQAISRLGYIQPNYYGFSSLSIDESYLAQGIFHISHCSGILREGIAFDSQAFAQPLFLTLPQENKPKQLTIVLVLPEQQTVAELPGYAPAKEQGRWQRQQAAVADQYEPSQTRDLELGLLNASVQKSEEVGREQPHLPVASLVLNQQNQYQSDSQYIAPCLRLACQDSVGRFIRHLEKMIHDLLTAPNSLMAEAWRGYDDGLSQLLTTVRFCASQGEMHPQQFFYSIGPSLLRLTGLLHEEAFPWVYCHENLQGLFEKIRILIRKITQHVAASMSQTDKLCKQSDSLWINKKPLELDNSRLLYLIVAWAIKPNKKVNEFVNSAKISTPQQLPGLIRNALPALPFEQVESLQQRQLGANEAAFLMKLPPDWYRSKASVDLAVYVPEGLSVCDVSFYSEAR